MGLPVSLLNRSFRKELSECDERVSSKRYELVKIESVYMYFQDIKERSHSSDGGYTRSKHTCDVEGVGSILFLASYAVKSF